MKCKLCDEGVVRIVKSKNFERVSYICDECFSLFEKTTSGDLNYKEEITEKIKCRFNLEPFKYCIKTLPELEEEKNEVSGM